MIETNRYATEYSLTDAPLVSVVILVYNVSRYLHACIMRTLQKSSTKSLKVLSDEF